MCGGRPPLTERALAALTDRAASRLAPTLSKYVSPSVGTKCGSRPYSICRTAPDGVVTSWRDHFQQRGEKPALLRPGDRRSPADSAPLPRDGRHRGARATTRAIRARGAVQQCGRDLQPKYPAPSPRALTSRPGGFRRYNSTTPRLSLLLVPFPTRLLARRSGSIAVHASHGGPPPAGVPVGSCSWWSRAAACDDRSGFLVISDDGVTRGTSR